MLVIMFENFVHHAAPVAGGEAHQNPEQACRCCPPIRPTTSVARSAMDKLAEDVLPEDGGSEPVLSRGGLPADLMYSLGVIAGQDRAR